MLGIKELKEELTTMTSELKKMTEELRNTKIAIQDSLKLTSDTIKEMSVNFSKSLDKTMQNMQDMKIQMNIKDTLIKSLGIENLLPEFLKKK